jgi:8-oxo-dGTP diphosphatase
VPHTVVVDVMLIIERDGLVLLAERSGTGYADGALNLPSGKLEPGEDVVAAVIREAHEEVGVVVDRADVRAVHVMQHLNPEGQTRVGWFFKADRWVGEPYNAEPHKCARLLWAPADHLPGNTWPYTAAGLAQYRAGTPFSLHGFAPEPVAV